VVTQTGPIDDEPFVERLNAFDGNPTTEWSSDGNGDDAHFTLQLDGMHMRSI
jgi:hypothetical protein